MNNHTFKWSLTIFLFVFFVNIVTAGDKKVIDKISSNFSRQCLSQNSSYSYSTSPVWDDSRLETYRGWQSILREASVKATKLLGNCGYHVQLNTVTGMSFDARNGINLLEPYSCTEERSVGGPIEYKNGYRLPPNHKTTLKINTHVVKVQRKHNTAARISTRYHAIKYDLFKYEFWEEVFDVTIEFFPIIFQTGEFYIVEENRWARNPVEAMVYVILHEFGHLESVVVKKIRGLYDRASLHPVSNSEDSANAFATSVVRCRLYK